MAIGPVEFYDNGTVRVYHSEFDHGGIVSEDAIVFPPPGPGLPGHDERLLVIECPFQGCDSASWVPVTGGHDPVNVQRLHIRKRVKSKGKKWQEAAAEVEALITAQVGAGHVKWRGKSEAEGPDMPPAPPIPPPANPRRPNG